MGYMFPFVLQLFVLWESPYLYVEYLNKLIIF